MEKNKKIFEIVQQCERLDEQKINDVLNTWTQIKNFAYIKHSMDSGKRPHWHIVLRLKNSTSYETVANKFGIEEQYVQKIKGTFADALAYLTHANAPEKHQYSDEMVESNFAWQVERDRAVRKNEDKISYNTIINLIAGGYIKRFQLDEIPHEIYIKKAREIENAFRYYELTHKTVERQMDVLFISGGTGTGKTTFAKMLAKKEKKSIFISSADNDLFYGYQGEPYIVLDDLRPHVFSASEFLKVTDNNTNSSVKARYKNVDLAFCEKLIITSPMDAEIFINRIYDIKNEERKQFYRRIKTQYKLTKEKIEIYKWDEDWQMYILDHEEKNNVDSYYMTKGVKNGRKNKQDNGNDSN